MNFEQEKLNIEKYVSITDDLLSDKLVDSMKQYHHHKNINTHFHSVYVSYNVMKMCSALNEKRIKEIVRAALLHDFYLYEWYTEKHDEYHIWYHPKQAVKNIESHFGKLSPLQKNMILSHMFPTCVELPKSRGAWLLTIADKRCATEDYLKLSTRFIPIYNKINSMVQIYD